MASTKKDMRFVRERWDQGARFYAGRDILPQTAQIRLISKLKTGTGKYSFNPSKDDSVKHIFERTLQRTDLFVTRAIGVALMVEKDDAPGQYPLFSYPVLDGACLPTGLKGFTDLNAYAIYNGDITMKTGQSVNYSRFPVLPCLHVPETQPCMIWNGAAGISAGIQPQFNIENVLYELPETLVFAGTKTQSLDLEFGIAPNATFGVPAGYSAYIVLLIEGWLYQSGATSECDVAGNPYKGKF